MKQQIEQAVQAAVKDLYGIEIGLELSRPDEQFGDYSTNAALQIAKQLGQNPRDVAASLREALQRALGAQVSDISVAGPGFINIQLSDAQLHAQVHAMLDTAAPYGRSDIFAAKTIVAEYSDPNPFKVLHAGHLYTTLVGDAIANLAAAAGGTVHRVNFGGDVGLHVGKCMWAILRYLGGEHPEKLAEIQEGAKLEWVSARYVEGNSAYEDDGQAKAEIVAINKRVYELHAATDRESPFAQVYWTCRQWSYDGFDRLYEQLEVKPFEKYYPESATTPSGLKIVAEGLEAGVFEHSDGAVVYKGEKHGLHTRVFINSSGLPTYEAKDLGLAFNKWDDYHFDYNFIITANDIVEYMKVLLAAIRTIHPEIADRTKHLTHGNIKLAGGVKMSSRKGNILRASDVIQAATDASQKSDATHSDDAILGAIKFAFLKQRIGADIIYDPEESVSLQGNSGPYLQYAHARAISILNKSSGKEFPPMHGYAFDAWERMLVRKLTEYPEIVETATVQLMPHHICTYLYELAQTFNRFYENTRVIGSAQEISRLTLVAAYAGVLKDGLGLLGITAPDSM